MRDDAVRQKHRTNRVDSSEKLAESSAGREPAACWDGAQRQ